MVVSVETSKAGKFSVYNFVKLQRILKMCLGCINALIMVRHKMTCSRPVGDCVLNILKNYFGLGTQT